MSVPSPSSGSAVRLSPGKRIGFSALAVTLIFLLAESVLALLGFSPERYESDPYVGFSANAPLFVEEKLADGTLSRVTARNKRDFFNAQQFAVKKPRGTYRIFCMGGSTAYGHPYADSTSFSGWLRRYLKTTAPDRSWEVINAGGISYASYREARLMEELIHYQPDLFVIYGSHNEFLERRLYDRVSKQSRTIGLLAGLYRVSRLATLIKNTASRVGPSRLADATPTQALQDDPDTELAKTLGPTSYSRNEPLRDQILDHYRFSLQRMVEMARSVGARIVFIVPASNIRESSPFKSQHRDGLTDSETKRWHELYDLAKKDLGSSSPTNSLALLDQAAALDDRYSQLHFARGRGLEKLGRYAEAKTAYERARDEDVCPLRATSEVMSVVRRAAEENHVPLIDFQLFLEAKVDHGILGANLFLDHVHTNIEGYRLLALEILKLMEREGLVRPNWDQAAIDRVTAEVSDRMDARVHGLALMNICKTLGWAGKREEAYRAGKQAAEFNPDQADVQYEAGLASFLSGRTDEAVEHYQRAVAIKATHALAHCNLGGILLDRGQLEESITHYRLAVQHGRPKDAARDQQNLTDALRKLAERGAAK